MISPENDKVQTRKTGNEASDVSQEEMTELIDGILTSLKTKFEDLSSQILSKMDTMSDRMDEMEKSLVDLLESSKESSTTDQDLN